MGIRSMAVIPLVNGTNVMGCLNLASTAINPFSEARKSFIQRVSWRITSIIGLHKTQEKLKSTVEILNETISDLRVKQQLLIQKSKMESLGELSAGMAHEINQPLVIISLSVENILQKMESTGNELSVGYLNRKFEAIQLNVKRIQQIIENLRIFARDQSGIHFERVSIREAVGKTMAMIGPKVKSESIQMVLEGVNDHHHVLGNIFNLEQVFINILSNSIYAVNEKNKGVQGAEYAKRISITVTMKEDRVFIDFGDNGTGIREEHIEKLFTPFYTTKMEHGTGLGLAIVYGIVKEMNGDIVVTSKVDEFTNVRLSFPSV
jgi:C4-dicarboxylate-specific signal transduction histidine kinase